MLGVTEVRVFVEFSLEDADSNVETFEWIVRL